MWRCDSLRVVSAILLLFVSSVLQAAIVGEARDRNGEVLYTEQHFIEGNRHRVEYRAPDDVLFATNEIDYSVGQFHPAYRQHNMRSDEVEGARWQQDTLVLFHTVGSNGHEKRFKAPKRVVLSAGIDHFVRDHWVALQRGDALQFRFAVPARLMLAEMRMSRVAGSDELTLRIEPVSRWLRLLSSPIELVYDDTRRLHRYRGISSLELGDDEPWVDVTYRYPD